MGRLAGFKYREVVRSLRKLGFVFDRQGPGMEEGKRMQESRIGVPKRVPANAADFRPGRCRLEVVGEQTFFPEWLSGVWVGKDELRIRRIVGRPLVGQENVGQIRVERQDTFRGVGLGLVDDTFDHASAESRRGSQSRCRPTASQEAPRRGARDRQWLESSCGMVPAVARLVSSFSIAIVDTSQGCIPTSGQISQPARRRSAVCPPGRQKTLTRDAHLSLLGGHHLDTRYRIGTP